MNILIVDDEAVIRQGLRKVIATNCLDVKNIIEAETGTQALLMLDYIDIVITDIKMPNMSGIELARLIHEKYPNIKVIISTGYPDFDYAQKAIRYNVVDFLLKPTNPEDLIATIEKARNEISKTQENINEDLKLRTDMFFHELIFTDLELADEKLEELGIENSNFRLYLIYAEETELAKSFLKEKLDKAFLIDSSATEFYLISSKDSIEILKDLLNEHRESSISIGSSTSFDNIQDIKIAISQAINAFKFSSYDDNVNLVLFSEIPQTKEDVLEKSIKSLEVLKKSIESFDAEKSIECLNDLFDYVEKEQMNYDDTRKICLMIYNFCISTIYNYSMLTSFEESKMFSIESILSSNKTTDIREKLEFFIREVIVFIGQTPNYMDAVIVSLKNYIEINYKENINLDLLASKAHFSPSYLSKLFKKQVGENISTYIQNVRIEKAKLLLKTSTMKTYEIAEAVGIEDPVYFSRIFKKVTGVKPKDYR